jgi:hypothetical protein
VGHALNQGRQIGCHRSVSASTTPREAREGKHCVGEAKLSCT